MSPASHRPSAPQRPLAPGTFRLGTVAGIDITVANSWFLIVGLIAVVMQPRISEVAPGIGGWAYVVGVAFAILLYFSVLLHEISHALAARSFDMPVSSINLHFLGGATQIEGEADTPWREFVIAVVGPLTSLVVGAVAFVAIDLFDPGLLRFAVGSLAGANLIVGVLNLVPGLPLDGGRVLQSVVWGLTRNRGSGVVVAAWGGRVAAVLAITWAPFIMPSLGWQPTLVDYLIGFMIGAFLWGGATQSLQVARIRSRLPGIVARRIARPAIGVPADLSVSEGVRRAEEARAGSIVVVTSDGRPAGIVNEDAVTSTPLERRPWVPIGDLARRLEEGLMLPADLAGAPLLQAMNRTPASEYVLVEPDGSVYGVLVARDVDAAFQAAG